MDSVKLLNDEKIYFILFFFFFSKKNIVNLKRKLLVFLKLKLLNSDSGENYSQRGKKLQKCYSSQFLCIFMF